MKELNLQIQQVKKSIENLKQHCDYLKNENQMLLMKEQELTKKYEDLKRDHLQLHQEWKDLKLAQGVAGNEEYRKSMKIQINRLINEVDYCIKELQTHSI